MLRRGDPNLGVLLLKLSRYAGQVSADLGSIPLQLRCRLPLPKLNRRIGRFHRLSVKGAAWKPTNGRLPLRLFRNFEKDSV